MLVNLTSVTDPAALITATAVAVVPTPVGPANVTVGAVTNPPPALVTVTTPNVPSAIYAVAAAPTPVLLVNATPGATVYPAPGFAISIVCTDFWLSPIFKLQYWIPAIRTAVAIPVVPPEGADDKPIVGGVMYPPPLFDIVK